MNKLWVMLYVAVIAAANILTASLDPLRFGAFIVPVGTFLIGATFVLRDFVQNAVGRKLTYATIAAAMLISATTSFLLGDTLWIVFASAATFAVSETTDTEIYSRLRLPISLRVLYSGLVGGVVDSVLFVLIGLSPLGAGFLPWEAVGSAIVGQILVKTAMQALGAGLIGMLPEHTETQTPGYR